MDVLKEMVRSLAVIIIFTSFLEMVLPNSKMKGYTRLILGLFVIIIVLNPVITLLDSGTDYSIEAWSSPPQNRELETIFQDAKDLAANSQESAMNEYCSRVEQQIAALVRLAPEIDHAKVEVELGEAGSPEKAGSIEQVVITAFVNKEEAAKNLRGENEDSSSFVGGGSYVEGYDKREQEQLRERLGSIVADFFGLMPDQVDVNLEY